MDARADLAGDPCPVCGEPGATDRFCGRCGAHLAAAVGPARPPHGQRRRAAPDLAPPVDPRPGSRPRSAPDAADPAPTPAAGIEPPRPRSAWTRRLLAGVVVLLAAAVAIATLHGGDDARDVADDEIDLAEATGDAGDGRIIREAAGEPPLPGLACRQDDCPAWRADLGAAAGAANLGHVHPAADGMLIVAVDRRVLALGPDGTPRWERGTDGDVHVDGGVVLLAADRVLRAVDVASGDTRWEVPAPDDVDLLAIGEVGPVVLTAWRTGPWQDGGRPVLVRAHDAQDGTLRWERTEDDVRVGPAGIVAIDHADPRLEGVDPGSGTTRWRTRLVFLDRVDAGDGPDAGAGPPFFVDLVDDGVVVTPNVGAPADAELRVLSLASGHTRGRHRLVRPVTTGPSGAAAWDGPVLLVSTDGDGERLVALDPAGGVRWARPLAEDGACCARVGVGDGQLLLAGPEPGRVRLLAPDTGRVRHEAVLDPEDGRVAPLGGRAVLVVAPDRRRAVDLADGGELWVVRGLPVGPAVGRGRSVVLVDGVLVALAHPPDGDPTP